MTAIIVSGTHELPKLWKRRRVTKALITRIDIQLSTLEGEADHHHIRASARQMLDKLKEHDAEFRRIHSTIIDLIDDEDTLITEQAILDKHDNAVASPTVHILALVNSTCLVSTTNVSKHDLLILWCDGLESPGRDE